MNQNPIGYDYTTDEALKIAQTLHHLELDNCELGETGGTALGQAIILSFKSKLQLKYLSVRNNYLADKAAVRIAAGLEAGGTKLQVLNLAGNGINDSGGEVLARAMKNNNTVQEFDLSHNNLRFTTAAAFLESLKFN